jgi:hypothetical protein
VTDWALVIMVSATLSVDSAYDGMRRTAIVAQRAIRATIRLRMHESASGRVETLAAKRCKPVDVGSDGEVSPDCAKTVQCSMTITRLALVFP